MRSGALARTVRRSIARVHSRAATLFATTARTMTLASTTALTRIASLADQILGHRITGAQFDLPRDLLESVRNRRFGFLIRGFGENLERLCVHRATVPTRTLAQPGIDVLRHVSNVEGRHASNASTVQASVERGRRPGLEAHFERVALRASGQIGREPMDGRLRRQAASTSPLDVGQSSLGAGDAPLARAFEGKARRQRQPFAPQVRCHPNQLATDVALVAAVDCHRDEAKTSEANADVVEIEVELGRDTFRLSGIHDS